MAVFGITPSANRPQLSYLQTKKTMAPLHDYKLVFSGRSVRKSWLSSLAPLMPPGHEMKHKPAADHANSRLI